jgi:hypothetical protein
VPKRATETTGNSASLFDRPPWTWHDILALLIWTAAITVFFWDTVSLRRALFYFDITEINYPYRAFFADELRAGRFSRWCPTLYCGLPLYSESQAGYLHPFKYLLYPWMATWQAFNLDTVLSVWLTGVGTYFWLRRHVGPAGALAGASIFGANGYVWAHLIHTSMTNALASVPFVVLGLEWSWASGRWRGVVLGGLALAFQVFAGHLQDALLTMALVGLYALYRAATERGKRQRAGVLAMAAALVALGVLLSAVQWIPSKELLDRSPRAGGLSWDDLTFGSWHPELLPTLVVREAYGTRARDTDWMDGFYPYHEMNAYMGLIAMALAVVGAGGAGARDRWTSFWIVLVSIGALLVLGKFTFLFDFAHRVPILGSSREPVRFHLWVALGVSAVAGVGVERISRPGAVSLRGGLRLAGVLVVLSIPIMIGIYLPVWTQPKRWTEPYHLDRYRWLGRELVLATIRTGILALLAWRVAYLALRTSDAARRARWAALLPLLILIDLLSAHFVDVPTVDPRYWTDPPESAQLLKTDPGLIRIFGVGDKAAGEPGYVSEPVDFFSVRDPLDWSLPAAWAIPSSKGETPMKSRRLIDYFDSTTGYHGRGRYDIDSVTHIVTGKKRMGELIKRRGIRAGKAVIYRNPGALPRARLAGRPVYAASQQQAASALVRLGPGLRNRLVVEDPSRPLAADASASGTARILEDLPERVVIATEAAMPAYLVLSDTFDPGWSARVDGHPEPIRPAYVAFRAVYLPEGKHTVVFHYRPAGFDLGLGYTGCGILLGLVLLVLSPLKVPLAPEHGPLDWPSGWLTWWFVMLVAIVLVSAIQIGPRGRITSHRRWKDSIHTHTWGSGYEAMRANRR